MITFWLTVVIAFTGKAPITLIDIEVASIESCLVQANDAITKASIVRTNEEFELQATCSIVRPPETPAGGPDDGPERP